jgi:hypothetical protein
VRGAYASRGGKWFVFLASTYEKNGVRISERSRRPLGRHCSRAALEDCQE